MFIIIVGAGGIGEALIEKFYSETKKHTILVIDKDLDNCNRIAEKYDIIVINGDATQSEVLDECEIEKADVLVTTTDSDSANLLTISLAKNKNVKQFVSIANREESIPLYMEKGVQIVRDPDSVMAGHLHKAIDHPRIEESLLLSNEAEIISFTINPEIDPSDAFIQDIQLPEESMIISVLRDKKVFLPGKNDKLLSGDQITVLTKSNLVDNIIELFLE